MNEIHIFEILFDFILTFICGIFIYIHINELKQIAHFKKISSNNFLKLKKIYNAKIKIDKYSNYYFPKMFGIYNKQKFKIRFIERTEDQLNKTSFELKFSIVIPNIIWILSSKIKKRLKIKQLINGFNYKSNYSELEIRYNNPTLFKILFNNDKIKSKINDLYSKKDFHSIIITSKTIKFYCLGWISNKETIINKIKMIFDLSKEIEKILIKYPNIKSIPKSIKEKKIVESTIKIFESNYPKKYHRNEESFILIGAAFIIIFIGFLILFNPMHLIESFFASSLLIIIGVFTIIYSYANYYFWNKWRISI
jgi:hypothetical protein